MSSDTTYRTVYQYNKELISKENMEKLMEIADDYRKVKNYVYQRYGGIRSLAKIYPGYTVQNEMTISELREQLGLPSVYFYLAIFEALGDIKAQWTHVKDQITKNINANSNLTAEEHHYLSYVIKVNPCFQAIILEQEVKLEGEFQEKFSQLRSEINEEKVNRYLCRQVRKHSKRMHTDKADGFAITERAYRYGEHGIYITVKEKRKRIFVLLTDGNQYKKQLYISLRPEECGIVIRIPLEIQVKQHKTYNKQIGLAIGMMHMLVTDSGCIYGDEYGKYQYQLNEYVRQGARNYRRNRKNNPGRKKYYAGKKRLEAGLHTYINKEINRLLKEEKPKIIYIPKLPPISNVGINKKINYSVGMWQRGYIRRRLMQKCQEQSIALVDVFGKDISNECSSCGQIGTKKDGLFNCSSCGAEMLERTNAARNVLKRGMASIK